MPTFDPGSLPALTVSRLPELKEASLTVDALRQDGSDRAYYRLRHSDGRPSGLLVMRFGSERAENLSFAPLTRWLRGHGVACPEIHHYDEDLHLIWLEDLGDEDLMAFHDRPWENACRPLYLAALEEVAKIHRFDEAAVEGQPPEVSRALQEPFDAALYRWEQDYFFDNFAANFSAAPPAEIEAARRDPALAALVDSLASLPRRLVHRDFQSRNILVRDSRVFFIDYQGMRFGLPEYDIASLLYDPYTALSPARVAELLPEAHRLGPSETGFEEYEDLFHRCAAQRLMQALGAYGFLGIAKQKRHFLDSIPPAVQNLRSVVEKLPDLDLLRPILELKPSQAPS